MVSVRAGVLISAVPARLLVTCWAPVITLHAPLLLSACHLTAELCMSDVPLCMSDVPLCMSPQLSACPTRGQGRHPPDTDTAVTLTVKCNQESHDRYDVQGRRKDAAK